MDRLIVTILSLNVCGVLAFAPPPRLMSHHRPTLRPQMPGLSMQSDDAKGDDFFSSLFRTIQQPRTQVETEEERLRRLRRERLAKIEAGEVRRANRVSEDKFAYALIFALQFMPLLGNGRLESLVYFYGVAVTTVYLGGRQETIEQAERVSKDNALFAPVFASASIGGLYLLLKNGIDITALYAVVVTLFGAISISDIGVPVLRNLIPGVDFANEEVPLPKAIVQKFKLDEADALPLDGLITLGLGLLCTAVYWSPLVMEQKFIASNILAWSLGMASLGAISLGSFQTGAILLGGLFFYDAFWVFGSDVMMTVATKVEAPVKFIFPADTVRDYNFSVLGLGDLVIPGLFVRLMAKADEALNPENFSYFNTAVLAYAFGLGACFTANAIFQNGQPALIYLDPSLVGSALACASANGQVAQLWDFQEEMDGEQE
mmetsp:Transcript_6868/g.14561  ORF Transcript_6868/g.14561 Transcript_6868/m.14561 type:complete len:432 (+) Transcript_6868:3-1298(+)